MSLIIPRNFKRANALDAAATDAEFKVGDRVVSIKTGRKGKIVSPGGRYNPMYGHYGHHEMWNVLFDDEKERIPVLMGSEEIRLANSRAADAGDAADAELKNALGGIFGKYKRELIDFAKSKRDEYQLEMNRTASKLTGNGNAGETLKAAQAGIRKIYEGVYALNGVHVQW